MADLVSGFIGAILVLVFLGLYAVGIHSLSFRIIAVAVGAMIVVDFVQSVKNEHNRNGP